MTGDTVADLAKDYLAKHAKVRKRSWQEDDRILNTDVLPHWRTRKVKGCTRRDVRALLERITDRGGAHRGEPLSGPRRVRCSTRHAARLDEANPATFIERPGTEQSRDRVLTDAEVRLVWTGCAVERPIRAR